jgi:hypothetical protein
MLSAASPITTNGNQTRKNRRNAESFFSIIHLDLRKTVRVFVGQISNLTLKSQVSDLTHKEAGVL